ncbi:four helix bundle protein [Desulfobacca acetoxidans]|uniref:four helix bundle protein n=1 Tax=Desulfobacca acetoxidans TaxID=60893 RepID=UPI001F3DE05A
MAKAVYLVATKGELSRDFGFRDQIRRSAVSVMANLAEGFERGRRTEFHQFISIAKSSCAELRSHLYLALDIGYLDQETFSRLHAMTEELSRILGGLRASVEKQKG